MVHLITGYKGSEHIQSADARSFNSAMFGNGEFVMEIGEQLDASILNNNTVRVLDGDVLMQGGHIRIETDTYEDLTIETGTAGKSRNDLIVMTYEKNSMDGTEKAYLEVIKGTETEGSASDPEYVTGTLAEGDLKNQMPLYRLKIEGVVLSTIETLFKTIPTYKTLAEQYAAQFQKACDTYLGALNILDSKEEIEANTLANQIAGALGVKQIMTSLNSNINTMFMDYNTLMDGVVVNSTTNVYPIAKGKNLSDYKFLVFTVLDGGSFRNPSILPAGMFGSTVELDYSSPTVARYVEFEKVNDSAIKIHGSGSSNPKAYVFGLKISRS